MANITFTKSGGVTASGTVSAPNIGVNTSTPGKTLDVNGSARATDFYVGTNGAYISYNSSTGAIEFNT